MSEIKAVFWDFGGVITSSPFESFNRLEAELGIPQDWIRHVNSQNPHNNAWAQLERSEIDAAAFGQAFRRESAALGHAVDGERVLAVLVGEVRPEMVRALEMIRGQLIQACLTNNVVAADGAKPDADSPQGRAQYAFSLFDFVLESSLEGVRKPEPQFYQRALQRADIDDPSQVVFLDDLGVNLKPARAMGMQTIKVRTGENAGRQALTELQDLLSFALI